VAAPNRERLYAKQFADALGCRAGGIKGRIRPGEKPEISPLCAQLDLPE
jgi:hypothetical protein